jgi:tetratricopeptide (TPR) repeat protein
VARFKSKWFFKKSGAALRNVAFFLTFSWLAVVSSVNCWAYNSSSDQAPEASQNLPTSPVPPIPDLLSQAKEDYARRAEPGKAQAAADIYGEIIARNPYDYDALWRSAACYYWLADDLPEKQVKPRELLFNEGLNMAKLALAVKPDASEGNFWFGVLLGEVSNSRGIFASLGAVNPIVESMERVLAADPQQAFACHILGMVYRLAPGWPFSCGDLNKSLLYASMAVAYRPDSVLTHLGLGETLLAKGRKKEAEVELNKALSLPGPAELQPETVREKKAVEKLLVKIEGPKWSRCLIAVDEDK